ncbi:MAG: tripartite tricarboxylate transporter substrate binding protein [Pseudomonadota bacterium]|nr:tripartite tricarboxylate transporter substrate binding protein [Pseudomonadota bacterium]
MRRRNFIATVGLSCTAPATVWAQSYPSRPIHIIVPFGAGSTTDLIGRSIGQAISADLGQQVVIENRPGAGGTIGAAEVARGAPDGYLLVLGTVASHAVAPSMMRGVRYDPIADFEPITLIADAPGVLVVHRSIPASNLQEFVSYLKSHPGTDYASAGVGTTTHLSGEAFKLAAGVSMTHVPYKAVGQAITDLLGGRIKVMFYQLPSVKPYIATGDLKLIAVTSPKRLSTLPEVPAIAETYPGFDFSAWFGMFAPANTPKPIIDRLYDAVTKAMKTPEVKRIMADQGLDPVGMPPDAFKSFLMIDIVKWKKIIAETNVKLE